MENKSRNSEGMDIRFINFLMDLLAGYVLHAGKINTKDGGTRNENSGYYN